MHDNGFVVGTTIIKDNKQTSGYDLNGPKILLPVGLVVAIFNSIPKDNEELRAQVIMYLRTYKERVERKGHPAEGFRLLADGTLTFESSLYDEAFYRGKIETYSRTIYELIEKLKSETDLLGAFGEEHQKALAGTSLEALGQRVGEGEEISKEQALLLQKIMPMLLSLSETTDGEENV